MSKERREEGSEGGKIGRFTVLRDPIMLSIVGVIRGLPVLFYTKVQGLVDFLLCIRRKVRCLCPNPK